MSTYQTIPEIFRRSVEKFPSRPAFGYVDDQPMTYSQLNEKVMGICAILEEEGIKKGDKVAIFSESCPHWAVAFLAVTTMGAVAVPILTQFHPSAIAHIGPSGENIYPEEVESVINQFDYVLESLVYSVQGKLVARIHLNYEQLEEDFGLSNTSESEVLGRIKKLLEDLKTNVNSKVSDFSRLNRIIEQTEPFEKTPTQKIKRYLYIENI